MRLRGLYAARPSESRGTLRNSDSGSRPLVGADPTAAPYSEGLPSWRAMTHRGRAPYSQHSAINFQMPDLRNLSDCKRGVASNYPPAEPEAFDCWPSKGPNRNRPQQDPAPEAEPLARNVFGDGLCALSQLDSYATRTSACRNCQTSAASPAEPGDLSSD